MTVQVAVSLREFVRASAKLWWLFLAETAGVFGLAQYFDPALKSEPITWVGVGGVWLVAAAFWAFHGKRLEGCALASLLREMQDLSRLEGGVSSLILQGRDLERRLDAWTFQTDKGSFDDDLDGWIGTVLESVKGTRVFHRFQAPRCHFGQGASIDIAAARRLIGVYLQELDAFHATIGY